MSRFWENVKKYCGAIRNMFLWNLTILAMRKFFTFKNIYNLLSNVKRDDFIYAYIITSYWIKKKLKIDWDQVLIVIIFKVIWQKINKHFILVILKKIEKNTLHKGNLDNWFNLIKENYLFNIYIENKNKIYQNFHEKTCYFRKKTLFFFVTKSPWPAFSAFSAFIFLFGFAGYLNFFYSSLITVFIGFCLVLLSFLNWLDDLVLELTFLKRFSMLIKKNLKLAFFIFVITEVVLFATFFWVFFHLSIEPAIQVATIWPPFEGIQTNSLVIPFLNTVFLLSSGAALVWLQYSLIAGKTRYVYNAAMLLFFYAFLFLYFQFSEYMEAYQQINDSAFGSTMYLLTFFHGLHVVIGIIILLVNLIRFKKGHFTPTQTLGFTLAGWYWHFVDVVWIFVFAFIYVWGTWLSEDSIINFIQNIQFNGCETDVNAQTLFISWTDKFKIQTELYGISSIFIR